jgi:hypothetical protein
MTTPRTARVLVAVLAPTTLLSLASCGADGPSPTNPRIVTLDDFAAASAAESPDDFADRRVVNLTTPDTTDATRDRPTIRTITLAEARDGVDDAVVTIGPPTDRGRPRLSAAASPAVPNARRNDETIAADPQRDALRPRRILVDRMVGQINGDPVYAAGFFEEELLDARFRASAQQLEPQAWVELAHEEIARALVVRIRDQLLLAEFYARLDEQQRQGVLFFLEQMRGDFIAEAAGSAALANERTQQTEQMTLDQKLRRELDKELIRDVLSREVARGINVSWRDIERYYYEHEDDFVTPGRAVLRIIRVPLDDDDTIDAIRQGLEAGQPFEALAEQHSTFRRSTGGMLTVDLGEDAYTDVALIGIDQLNDAAHQLAEGRVSPLVEARGSAWWIKLESLTERQVVPLFDAQNAIQTEIFTQRFDASETRYFTRLFSKASLDSIEVMVDRLLAFAIRRYLDEDPSQFALPGSGVSVGALGDRAATNAETSP